VIVKKDERSALAILYMLVGSLTLDQWSRKYPYAARNNCGSAAIIVYLISKRNEMQGCRVGDLVSGLSIKKANEKLIR
jgi:hypothetical protein